MESIILNRLLANLLNLKPTDISSITFASEDESLILANVTLKSTLTCCSICGSKNINSKGFYTTQFITTKSNFQKINVNLNVPRSKCKKCGHSFSDKKVITPPRNKNSYNSIIHLMDLLKDPKMTFNSAAKLSGMSVTTAIRMFDKYVHIPKTTLPEVLCIDEVYCKTSEYNSKYICVLYDFMKNSIVDILPTRRKRDLSRYFESITEEERNNVKYVSMDMYKNYKDITKKYFKKAIICIDSFHVIKNLNECLNRVRIRILNSYDSNSQEYYLLKNFKYLLFNESIDLDNKPKFNKKFNKFLNHRQLLSMILSIDDDLHHAYHIYKAYYVFNRSNTVDTREKDFENIYNDLVKYNIPEFTDFLISISNWKEEILNSFTIYNGRRINNSVAEGINSQISTVLFNSKGFKNWNRKRKRIMYSINKDGFNLV